MEWTEPAPLCIENLKRQAQEGWTLIRLCQKQTFKHYWKVPNNMWAAVLTGAL